MSEFKTKSVEELEKLSAEDLATYYNEHNDFQRKEIAAQIEAKASQKDIDALKAHMNETIVKQMEALNGALKEQGLAIKKLTEGEKIEGAKTLRDSLTGYKEQLAAMKAGKDKNGFNLSIKAPGTITGANVSGGNVPVEQREAGLNVIAVRTPIILGLIQRAIASSNIISWVQQANKDGTAGGTAEGVLKNQIDFDLVVVSETLKKRTAFIKVSKEMLEDVDFLQSEINNELNREHSLDIDDQLLNGDDTGTNLNGILTQATAFAAGTFAVSINEANNWDVLKVAMNQVNLAFFEPSVIVMHPSDVTEMNLTKASDGHYVMPPFQSAEGMIVSGLRIVATTAIAADNFLVMDGSRATAYFKGDSEISVGFENDDFTKNLVTILIESRLLLRIKGNDTGAFVTGDFTTAKAALETV